MQTKQTNRMPSVCKDILFSERLFFSALKIASFYHCKWLIINNICFPLSFDNFDMITIGILLLAFPKHFFPGWSFPIGKVWLGKAINYFSSSYCSAFFSCFFLLSPFDFFFLLLYDSAFLFFVWLSLSFLREVVFVLLLLHWSARPAPESSNFACSLLGGWRCL